MSRLFNVKQNLEYGNSFRDVNDWNNFYQDTLGVRKDVIQSESWKKLSTEEYQRIYEQAIARFQSYPYNWAAMTMVDAALFLGKPEKIQEIPDISFDQELLNRAARFSTLDVVKFLVEKMAIKPFLHHAQIEVAAGNKYPILTYLIENSEFKATTTDLLLSALGGRNFEVADILMKEHGPALPKDLYSHVYSKILSNDDIESFCFLVERDYSDSIDRITQLAYKSGAVKCLNYLVTERKQTFSKEALLDCEPEKNAETVKGIVDQLGSSTASITI